jgi:citrate lyase subunit beta/citryl-CoA lyase
MQIKTASAGNTGEKIRSDCHVDMALTDSGGISLDIRSKVWSLYGDSIITLCREMLAYFGIVHARLEIDDTGALPFTIAARLEAVIKKLVETNKSYLMPVSDQNMYGTHADADRISRLYLPGNNPKLMINAGLYGSHGIILDLEDSVAPDRKDEARLLVRNALGAIDFQGAERMVRINQLPAGLADLEAVIPQPVNMILIPKCEEAAQVVRVNEKIASIRGQENHGVHLMPIIENAAGVMHALEIATASRHVVALAIGLEDYVADIGVQRSAEGRETYFARSMVVNAARAAGIQPIDSVFSDVENMEALARYARESKSMGFAGMGCIHPRQIPVIHEGFLPGDAEVERAKRIVLAYEQAEKEGLGVVAVDAKMIDAPVVKRAIRTLEQAVKYGKLNAQWRENHA